LRKTKLELITKDKENKQYLDGTLMNKYLIRVKETCSILLDQIIKAIFKKNIVLGYKISAPLNYLLNTN
jgi:hypothetical protein